MGVAEILFNIFKGRGAVLVLCIPVVPERYSTCGLNESRQERWDLQLSTAVDWQSPHEVGWLS